MKLCRASVFCFILLVLICVLGFQQAFADTSDEDQMSQVGIFSVLKTGDYNQITTVDEMNAYGDFGVGGFESMDGELIQLNGTVYQVTSDGVVHTPPGDTGVTFMNTVRFNPELMHKFSKPTNLSGLENELTQSFPSKDNIYAIRVDGIFPNMTVRSVPVQQKPYPPLEAVITNQSVFNLTNTTGTISGFWYPDWMDGVNYAGYHLHYISADRTAGGHILDFSMQNGTAMMDPIHSFSGIIGT